MATTYPDPNNPVVIQATQQLNVANDFFLRRVGFLSVGESNKTTNSITAVDGSSYLSSLKDKEGELAQQMKAFFAYAGQSKEAYIVEVGGADVVPGVTHNLTAFIDETSNSVKLKNGETPITTATISGKPGDTLVITKEVPEATEALRYEIALPDSSGILVGREGQYSFKEAGNIQLVITGKKIETTKVKAEAQDTENPEGTTSEKKETETTLASATISVSSVQITPTYKTAIANAVNLINERSIRLYVLCVPNLIYTQKQVSDLYALTNGVSSAFYVFTESKSLLPTDEHNLRSDAFKGVMVVYDTNTTFKSLGSIAGVFASSSFDISESNPASPLNFKSVSGNKSTLLTSSQNKYAVEQHFTYIGEVGGQPVILNGRMRDGETFDYWYQWDLVSFYLTQTITSLLVNSSDNPRTGIRYNQGGIDTLQAVIETELAKQKTYNTITDFGTHWDTASNSLQNSGKIYAESFTSYIASNYDNYQKGIYAGISFTPLISRYPQQIIISADLR